MALKKTKDEKKKERERLALVKWQCDLVSRWWQKGYAKVSERQPRPARMLIPSLKWLLKFPLLECGPLFAQKEFSLFKSTNVFVWGYSPLIYWPILWILLVNQETPPLRVFLSGWLISHWWPTGFSWSHLSRPGGEPLPSASLSSAHTLSGGHAGWVSLVERFFYVGNKHTTLLPETEFTLLVALSLYTLTLSLGVLPSLVLHWRII